MPLINVKATDFRFEDPDANARLVKVLTDAICSEFGEDIREKTWVILEGVGKSEWGFGGKVKK